MGFSLYTFMHRDYSAWFSIFNERKKTETSTKSYMNTTLLDEILGVVQSTPLLLVFRTEYIYKG